MFVGFPFAKTMSLDRQAEEFGQTGRWLEHMDGNSRIQMEGGDILVVRASRIQEDFQREALYVEVTHEGGIYVKKKRKKNRAKRTNPAVFL